MTKRIFFTANQTHLMAATMFLTVLTGCIVEGSGEYQGQAQATVGFQDDYDYYPGYETYYSRNRHEFVYLEGNVWVRRPEPRGVSLDVFLAAPSVRLDFHDAPEHHHSAVIRSYPKTWKNPDVNHNARPEPSAIRPEHQEVKPEPSDKKQNTAEEVRPPEKQKKQTDAEANHPNNEKDKPKEDHPDNKPDDKKDDNKGQNRPGN